MMPFGYIVLLSIIFLPTIEIAGFVMFGATFGILSTILLTIATAFGGGLLLRHRGVRLAMAIRAEIEAGRSPALDIVLGLLTFIAGVCLLIPGFFSDLFGLIMLLPPVRFAIARRVFSATRHPAGSSGQNGGQASGEKFAQDSDSNTGKNQGRPSTRDRPSATIDLDPSDWRKR